jgi:hypothetical protein
MFIRPPPTTMTLGAGIMCSVVDSGQVGGMQGSEEGNMQRDE